MTRHADPRGAAPSRVPRGQGREALLGALVRVAARDGLDAVRHRSVAAEASVTHGLATYHFASRDEMVREALVWATRRALEQSGIGEVGETLETFGASIPARIADDPGNAGFQFELAIEGHAGPSSGPRSDGSTISTSRLSVAFSPHTVRETTPPSQGSCSPLWTGSCCSSWSTATADRPRSVSRGCGVFSSCSASRRPPSPIGEADAWTARGQAPAPGPRRAATSS
ncbi:MAG: TetR family transcriptional regulator [Actinobacteria bacterium]|nr:TetR family transcriptional regulator [Actinomycetota bacterium]